MPFFMSSYFIAHGIKRKHGIIIIWDLSVTGIWLQFRSVVVLMIRRLGYCKMLFITLLFGYSILGNTMGQLDRLHRTTDSVALVWHDQEQCLSEHFCRELLSKNPGLSSKLVTG